MPHLIDALLDAPRGEEPPAVDLAMLRSDTPFGVFVFWAYDSSLLTHEEITAYNTLLNAKGRLLRLHRDRENNPALEEIL